MKNEPETRSEATYRRTRKNFSLIPFRVKKKQTGKASKQAKNSFFATHPHCPRDAPVYSRRLAKWTLGRSVTRRTPQKRKGRRGRDGGRRCLRNNDGENYRRVEWAAASAAAVDTTTARSGSHLGELVYNELVGRSESLRKEKRGSSPPPPPFWGSLVVVLRSPRTPNEGGRGKRKRGAEMS